MFRSIVIIFLIFFSVQVFAFGEKALPVPKPLPKSKALPVGKALPALRALPVTKAVRQPKGMPALKRLPKSKPLVLKSRFAPRSISNESPNAFDPRYDSP